jgi:hypothetical protein
MEYYDFCIAWNWEHDADFVAMMGAACQRHGCSVLQITPNNLLETSRRFVHDEIGFRAFFDRASDTDGRFLSVIRWAESHSVFRINPQELARRTWDKASTHLSLIDAGLYTPYTIILPPYNEQLVLPPLDLSPLGEDFVVKPAHGGGGEGVVMRTNTAEEVLAARQEKPGDSYLLQAYVAPVRFGSRPAWFRVIYCAGQIYPNWWDTRTHMYVPVSKDEEERYGLTPLRDMTATIARIFGLHLFSTEIAYNHDGHFVAIDNVNDQIDLRLQSKTPDGVPDEFVRDISERLAGLVVAHCSTSLDSRRGGDWS